MDSNYVQQFKKGTLEMLLLCLIARKETYGYEIINALNDNSAAVFGYAMPVRSGKNQRRQQKILFLNRKGERTPAGASLVLEPLHGLRRRFY